MAEYLQDWDSRILLLTQLIANRTSCRKIRGNRARNFKFKITRSITRWIEFHSVLLPLLNDTICLHERIGNKERANPTHSEKNLTKKRRESTKKLTDTGRKWRKAPRPKRKQNQMIPERLISYFRRNVPFIRKVRVLCKKRLIFPRINGPIVTGAWATITDFYSTPDICTYEFCWIILSLHHQFQSVF